MFSMNIKLYIERKKCRSCRLKCGLIMIPCVRVWRNPLVRPRPVAYRLSCVSCVLVVSHLHHFIATASLVS